MSSSRGGAVVFLVRLAMFLLVFTALAEVWLRTITPAREVPHPYQADPATIVRFDPSFRPDGETTVGRLARPGGRWRINNGGWNSAVDCVSAAARDRPLVALFGRDPAVSTA